MVSVEHCFFLKPSLWRRQQGGEGTPHLSHLINEIMRPAVGLQGSIKATCFAVSLYFDQNPMNYGVEVFFILKGFWGKGIK